MRIAAGIREKYTKVAVRAEGSFRYPTGRAGLEELKYGPQFINRLPADAVSSYCGVGNPFLLGPINEGETALDIGCGGGVDTMIAAMMVGLKGKGIGIDLMPAMLERAKENLRKAGLGNVSFQQASGEEIPFLDDSFDVVISNGVFNLIPDKENALHEVFRVLVPGGRLMIADQMLTGPAAKSAAAMADTWAG
jgi:arsenite methyltransferase